jgi:hypothetical protein
MEKIFKEFKLVLSNLWATRHIDEAVKNRHNELSKLVFTVVKPKMEVLTLERDQFKRYNEKNKMVIKAQEQDLEILLTYFHSHSLPGYFDSIRAKLSLTTLQHSNRIINEQVSSHNNIL